MPREARYERNRLGAARAERDVVFAGAALVGVASDGEGITAVGLQPLRLLVEGRGRLRRQVGPVAFEEHAIADVNDEILLAARGCRAGDSAIGAAHAVLVGAGAHRQRHGQNCGQLQPLESLEDTHLIHHSGASTLAFCNIARCGGSVLISRRIRGSNATRKRTSNS